MPTIHLSEVGTFHPNPADETAWTINDTRGYLDPGPACDNCGACDCVCERCGDKDDSCAFRGHAYHDSGKCVGLSFAFICLDGGDALCEECAEREGIEIIECDCA